MSALIISHQLYEKRPLKRQKLGPPDVYPQDPKQKEDELTAINVKHGYNSNIVLSDEYGTARNANITQNRMGEYFGAILAKKHELNTLADTSRKKQPINKENIMYVTAKTKAHVDSWFKDLATNNKSYGQLSRKVPFFNKKEEMFGALYDFNVPMFNAQWFLKISYANQTALSESNNKSKKRQIADPSQEWTSFLCKFLKEHYYKLIDSLNGGNNNSNSSSLQSSLMLQQNVPPPAPQTTEELLKQWIYYNQLAEHLYEAKLLDRHEFLSWLVELFEKIKSVEDVLIHLVVPMLVHFVDEFTQSEFLSRRIAYHCAKKINQLLVDFSVEIQQGSTFDADNNVIKDNADNSTGVNNDKTNKPETSATAELLKNLCNGSALDGCFKDITACRKYRSLLISLSAIIQGITLDCPTALVWLNLPPGLNGGDGSSGNKSHLPFNGSPLDYLPCEPSNLPISKTENTACIRRRLRMNEELIKMRSQKSEKRWFFRTFESSQSLHAVEQTVNGLLNVLDALDRHMFDKVNSSNSLETLYHKVFVPLPQESTAASATSHSSSPSLTSNTQPGANIGSSTGSNVQTNSEATGARANKTMADIVEEEADLVRLLCEWAVTSKRFGEHRARVVAILLERRQTEINEREKVLNEQRNPTTRAASSANEGENRPAPANDAEETGEQLNKSADESIEMGEKTGTPIFQAILFDFLDNYAPVYDDTSQRFYGSSSANKPAEYSQAFKNLILLFSELIRFEVFSHDAYMCTLISLGLFTNHPCEAAFASGSNGQASKSGNDGGGVLSGLVPLDTISNGGLGNIHKSTSSSSLPMFDPMSNNSNVHHNEQSSTSWLSMNIDNDEDNLDEDLGKLVQNITSTTHQGFNDQNDNLPDGMESDKEDDHGLNLGGANHHTTSLLDLAGGGAAKNNADPAHSLTRHLFYTLHFPLPSDEFYAHECSQRHILLYGVGKAKDEARHSVKKVTKEIMKIFNRKSSIDISEGGKVKKHVFRECFNYESAISKFQSLSIFDQQQVTNSCAATVLEMLNGVGMGNANHLPLVECIAFLFDLMELALNVNGLIELVSQILKELVDVDSQLQQKCSILTRPYYTSIGLFIVGVLYRYHNYVVASNEDILTVFEGLWKIVRRINNPGECASAERCIFYYIYDLYSSCAHVQKKYHDTLSPVINKIKAMSSTQNETNSNMPNSCVMMEYLKNPKTAVDANHIHELNANPQQRYALVFYTIKNIAETTDMDRLNETSVLCAELTAACSSLSNEWIEVFKALCCSAKTKNAYSALLSQINIGDRTIYDNLAVFTSILVARRCLPVGEFITNVCVPSLMLPFSSNPYEESERNARLTCHLMLYLFKYYDSPLATSNSAINSSFASSSRYSLTSPGPLGLATVAPPTSVAGKKPPFFIKYACDRYLLGGALNSLRIELIATVIKAIFVLRSPPERKNADNKNMDEMFKSNSDDLSEMGILGQITKSKTDDKPSLSEFAKYVLKQICSQDWVHDRCLRDFNPEFLSRLFIEKRFSHKDAQQLLNMICFHKQVMPNNSASTHLNDKAEPKVIINRIFQNLDEWSIRAAWLQLYLIYEQLHSVSINSPQSHSSEVNQWLETLARSIVEFFQNSSQQQEANVAIDPKRLTLFTSKSANTFKPSIVGGPFDNDYNALTFNQENIWLIGSLINKLPSSLQSKILRVTANIFDSTSWISIIQQTSGPMSSKSKTFQASKNSNSLLNSNGIFVNTQNPTSAFLFYQPFVSLLLACLRSREDDRNSLLSSLYTQISQCITEKLSDDIRTKRVIQDGLQLRFSLIGAMFETIQGSTSLTNDWAQLLAQLISFNIVDPHIQYESFSSVLDMLTSLIHITQMSLMPDQREETKKVYQNLIKKVKKELNIERVTLGVRMARQLLPIAKQQIEVISCEPMGSLVDTKGNKIANFDSTEKKQGLQVADKIKLSPWDLLEGHKHPQPLSWTSFGGVRIERKPMRMEENFYLMSRHHHNVRKPTSYYIEPPPLPPEEDTLPPPQQQQQQQMMQLNQQPLSMLGNNVGVGGGPMHHPLGGYNGSGGGPMTSNALPPNCNMSSTPLLNNMISQASPTFNTSNMMHPMQQQQQQQQQPGPQSSQPSGPSLGPHVVGGIPPGGSQGMPNNFHPPPSHPSSHQHVQSMNSMAMNGGPMSAPNGMPQQQPTHSMQPMPGGMHGPNMNAGGGPGGAGPPGHMMAGGSGGLVPNDHPMGGQGPPPHHMMMNNHNQMMGMGMGMDNRDMMMDTLPPPSSQMLNGPPGPSGGILGPPMGGPLVGGAGMRPPVPNMLGQISPQMNLGGAGNVRAPTPKKPKAPRKRRTTKNTAPVNNNQVNGMAPNSVGSSFDAYNQSVTPPVGQNNNWQYQPGPGGPGGGQAPLNNMMGSGGGQGGNVTPGGGQQFYSQGGMQGGPPNPPIRLLEPNNANSKARLRAILNTRSPAAAGQANNGNGSLVASGGGGQPSTPNPNMMPANTMNYPPNPRQQMQPLMQQRAPLRSHTPMPQPINPPGVGGGGGGQMFQQQQQQHHHMQQQQQQQQHHSNFGGNQNFNVPGGGMQGMEPQGNNFPNQSPMSIRPQMQPGNQQQFMQQRSQYSNMGQQQSSMGHFGAAPQQQVQPSNQSMMGPGGGNAQGPPHWPNQMGQPRPQQMTQLQRQLSANQGGPPPQPVQPGHATPYHQVQY